MTEIKLKSGEMVKAYPLTGSQNMMYLMSLKYGSGYPVNNIGCGYYWQGDLHIGILKESVYEAIERCDTMRLRFVKDGKINILQYVTEKSELKVENWDYSEMTVEEAEEFCKNNKLLLIVVSEFSSHVNDVLLTDADNLSEYVKECLELF